MRDTTDAAHDRQIDVYRSMPAEARLAAALELSATSRRLLGEGVRMRHPEYTAEEVRLATIRLWLGAELFRAVYPDAPEVMP